MKTACHISRVFCHANFRTVWLLIWQLWTLLKCARFSLVLIRFLYELCIIRTDKIHTTLV